MGWFLKEIKVAELKVGLKLKRESGCEGLRELEEWPYPTTSIAEDENTILGLRYLLLASPVWTLRGTTHYFITYARKLSNTSPKGVKGHEIKGLREGFQEEKKKKFSRVLPSFKDFGQELSSYGVLHCLLSRRAPRVAVPLVVTFQWLGSHSLAPKKLRHFHDSSHGLSRPSRAVKWLVCGSLTWGSLVEPLPHHHGWHHDPWWPPRAVKACMEDGQCLGQP
ncbi:hypothetical protein MTR67_018825 [Solanum verrucosum]|uniref:Uncharacterized protein n=1 Tax=Solanum verrucosum TaxID=315347 RepID=A0AAF0QQL1_SOLVR|nr:hypothetical protein MTR67_018825 [Solanum verrucosum]